MQAAKAQVSMCISMDSPELLVLADVIITENQCTAQYIETAR